MAHLQTNPSPAPSIRNPARDSELGRAQLIDRYLAESVILDEDWENLPLQAQEAILLSPSRTAMLKLLVQHGLQTEYQSAHIQAGTTFGLVMGSYRILDRIGEGGIAVVFRAEHIDLRHIVAIKVLPISPGQDARLEHRFFAEMRAIAKLRHPNIVTASDAGRLLNPDPLGTSYRYLVMEHLPGQDLEDYVLSSGPLPIGRACNIIYQVASALAETHKLQMVHRDIKPSNIMVTAEDQAKLLDFGLTMHFQARMTMPGTVLGTIDFMAPEQGRDASMVDIRSDIYGLGGTLFFALTGRLPFPQYGSAAESLARRLTSKPRALAEYLQNCPPDLDRIVSRMMASNPEERFPTPQAVMQALLDFIRVEAPEHLLVAMSLNRTACRMARPHATSPRVLVADDEFGVCDFARHVLSMLDLDCDAAESGEEALEALKTKRYDLLLLDMFMPGLSGLDVMKQIRADGRHPHMKIILMSGQATPDEMAQQLLEGADDFLTKPFSWLQFQGRVRSALRLKAAQDRLSQLNEELTAANAQLEESLQVRDLDLSSTRRTLVMSLAHLVELRDTRDVRHLNRMQRYSRALAEAALTAPAFGGQLDAEFIRTLECCMPLHDVGKVGLPDHILLKAGALSLEERILMQTHTTFAADTLQGLAHDYPAAGTFLRMSIDVIRHHHERFDGSGYPDRLAGAAIPLAARIVTICDVYDALRSRKPYKPSLSHDAAAQIIMQSTGQFDPALLEVFPRVASEFEAIFAEDSE